MYQPSIVLVPLWIVFVYQWLLLGANRYAMVRAFVPQEVRQEPQNHGSISRMYRLGRRFDTKVLSIIIGIPMLVSCTILVFTPVIATGLASLIFLFCLILNGIVVGNFYYFKTYNNYYDIFMFGLVEDDTQAVLKNIYDDYPIIRLLIGVLLSAIIPSVFLDYAISYQWFAWESVLGQVLIGIVSLVILIFAARGSIRSKPLGRGHAQVSTLSILNKMVPDGVTAMSWAWTDRKRQISFTKVSIEEGQKLLEESKILSILKDAICHQSHEENKVSKQTSHQGEDKNKALACFYTQTPANAYLAHNKPHVVFALMESFATNYLIYDDEQHNDLLGRLRPYWKKDFVFERFCSDYNGTAPSLANIFFHSHVQNISQSIVQNKSLQETPFEVYKAQGYKTVFITAGNMMWRNLANYLPLQGVDLLYDQNSMMEYFPEAKKSLSYWGIADEYAFRMAEKLLQESKEPLFIAILSMTNHPPYQVPSHYNPKVLNATCLQGRYGQNDEERLLTLGTYQYACDALGGFIDAIEQSSLAGQTIIAATGDHHVRGVYADVPKELFVSKAVPFFVHIPELIRQALPIQFNPQRLGSHKDIMPTLYHLSLSETTYWHGVGVNLLAQVLNPVAFNETLFATPNYVVDAQAQPLVAYQWAEGIMVGEEHKLTDEERRQVEAFQQFLVWQTNYLATND